MTDLVLMGKNINFTNGSLAFLYYIVIIVFRQIKRKGKNTYKDYLTNAKYIDIIYFIDEKRAICIYNTR